MAFATATRCDLNSCCTADGDDLIVRKKRISSTSPAGGQKAQKKFGKERTIRGRDVENKHVVLGSDTPAAAQQA